MDMNWLGSVAGADVERWLNSEIFKSLVGSLAGAFAGAWAGARAVQRVADRAKRRDMLREEVRNTNAAIALAHTAFNTFVNAKEQHILELKTAYDAQKAAVVAHHNGLQEGAIPAGQVLIIGLNMKTIDVLRVRLDRLEDAVMAKLSTSGRPVPLVATLGQTLETLNLCIRTRNDLIKQMLAFTGPEEEKLKFMFGLPRNGGVIDDTFGDLVRGAYSSTDDGIYFTWRLLRDLNEHGNVVRKRYLQEFRSPVPTISEVMFDKTREKGLLPDESKYEDWETAFIGRVQKTQGLRWRKLTVSLRRRWRAVLRIGAVQEALKLSLFAAAMALVALTGLIALRVCMDLFAGPVWNWWEVLRSQR